MPSLTEDMFIYGFLSPRSKTITNNKTSQRALKGKRFSLQKKSEYEVRIKKQIKFTFTSLTTDHFTV